METYSLVNGQVRRKLDELLKTWKEPVPGSRDPTPVFPVEVTRPIENDLIRWRTMDIQRQQQEAKSQQALLRAGRPPATPWHGTSTPTQHTVRYQQPPTPGYSPQLIPNGQAQVRNLCPYFPQYSPTNVCEKTHSPYPAYHQYPPQPTPPIPHQAYPQPNQPQYAQRPVFQHQPQPSPTLELLNRDIDNLIHRYRDALANNFNDVEIQTKLHALLQLQTILTSQTLQPHELEAIRVQLAQLTVGSPLAPLNKSYVYSPAPAAVPYSAPSNPPAYLPPSTPTHYSPPPATPLAPPPVQPPQTDLSNLLNSNALAGLLASVKAQQPAPTPPVAQVPTPQPPIQYSQPSSTPTPALSTQPNSIIASLRAAGILPPEGNTPVNGAVPSAPNPVQHSTPAPSTPNVPVTAPTVPPTTSPKNDVELTSASLKMYFHCLHVTSYVLTFLRPRLHLVRSLFEAFPNQCSTCGKRFLSTPEGKKKKQRHLDWHFRIGMKREEAAKRGQSRSWYVSELVSRCLASARPQQFSRG